MCSSRSVAALPAVTTLASTHRALLAAVAICVPKLARCCVPIVLEGERWRQLGAAHEDAHAQRIIEKLARHFEAWLQAGTGRAAELMLCRSCAVFDRLETPALARLGERLHLESLIVVPMVVSGRLLGWLCFGRGESRRAVDRQAALALSDLAAVCAAALERARLVEQLRAAVESRDTLLATVSHDLRSPLNAIALTVRSLGPEPHVCRAPPDGPADRPDPAHRGEYESAGGRPARRVDHRCGLLLRAAECSSSRGC